MGEEEWAPGQVVQQVGGQDESWLFLCPFSRVRFLLFFLFVGGQGSHYDRLGRPGVRNMVYRKPHRSRFGSWEAAAMAPRAARSEIENKRLRTHHREFRKSDTVS